MDEHAFRKRELERMRSGGYANVVRTGLVREAEIHLWNWQAHRFHVGPINRAGRVAKRPRRSLTQWLRGLAP